MTRLLGAVFVLLSLACVGLFVVAFGFDQVGVEGRVCQVFKYSKTTHLWRDNYAGFYNVAVTPANPNELAKQCELFTITSDPHIDLLEKKVVMWPLDKPKYAYYESRNARIIMFMTLGAGILLLTFGFWLMLKED